MGTNALPKEKSERPEDRPQAVRAEETEERGAHGKQIQAGTTARRSVRFALLLRGDGMHRLAGFSALNAPLLASSSWYCRPSGMRPAVNHSDTDDAATPSTRATALWLPKCSFASSGVMCCVEIRSTELFPDRHTECKSRDAAGMQKTETCGARIRRYRLQAGYKNQKEFARLIGVSAPSLSELENHESKYPSARTLLRAAAVLGVDPWHLLTGEGPPIRAVQHLRQDEIRLLLLYRELSLDQQHELEVMANRLHNEAHPQRSLAMPFSPPPTINLGAARKPHASVRAPAPGRKTDR